jgi:DNA topoisomerase IB
MGRLHRVSCASPGFSRRRRGRGFEYLDEAGRPLRDDGVVERIRALAIPPAWTDVWICPDPDGHLQAVGTDAAGRRQYLYDDRWRQRRDQQKFDRMLEFAAALPRLRRAVARDLDREELSRERVLAAAVRLLDLGLFRVGGEEYADRNGSYGLATLERDHVTVGRAGTLEFDYPAKGGARRVRVVIDPAAGAVVAALKRRRGGGRSLLAFRDGVWCDVRSGDVNEYIRAAVTDDFSAKDFRTWHANVLLAVVLAHAPEATSERARRRELKHALEEVADELGNTPAICRTSYVDPQVIDLYLAGTTIPRPSRELDELSERARRRVERAVIELLARGR